MDQVARAPRDAPRTMAKRRMIFVDRDRGPVEIEIEIDPDKPTSFIVEGERGPIEVKVDPDEVASFTGRHHAAIPRRLRGDSAAFADIEGWKVRIGDEIYVPETDDDVLVDLYFSGELDYSDPYDVDFLSGGGGG